MDPRLCTDPDWSPDDKTSVSFYISLSAAFTQYYIVDTVSKEINTCHAEFI